MADTPPSQKPYIYHRYRFGRARVGLAEARFSQHKSFFRNFWSHGPQNRCIWSKISRGNRFWRLKLSIPSKIQEKWWKTDFRNTKKSHFFPNRFFDVLVVAKRRRRLEFWRRVVLDFPDDPERPKDEQNRFFSINFHENFEIFSKSFQKKFKIFAIAC